MTNYNGWTNYATWRVNLEIFDGMDMRDMGWHKLDLYDMAQMFRQYVEEIVCPFKSAENSLAESYALAFLSDVDWHALLFLVSWFQSANFVFNMGFQFAAL